MTRLINADELKDWSEIVPLTDDGGIDINDFEEKLRSMPTIDAEPVRHGKWIPSPSCAIDSRGFTDMFKCSECKRYSYYAYPVERLDYKYCPHCGARMDEDER